MKVYCNRVVLVQGDKIRTFMTSCFDFFCYQVSLIGKKPGRYPYNLIRAERYGLNHGIGTSVTAFQRRFRRFMLAAVDHVWVAQMRSLYGGGDRLDLNAGPLAQYQARKLYGMLRKSGTSCTLEGNVIEFQ